MKKSFFKNCLAFFLSVALIFSAVPSMAMPVMSSGAMAGHMQTMVSMHATSQIAHNCCANGMQDNMPQHGMMCGHCAVCAFCAAAYVAPSTVFLTSLQVSARYERVTETAISGKTLMPDTPPPKA